MDLSIKSTLPLIVENTARITAKRLKKKPSVKKVVSTLKLLTNAHAICSLY